MTRRAEAAAQTSENVLRVVGQLWMKYPMHEITLEQVAAGAGITVRTILRKYGSKEGLIDAAIQQDSAGIIAIKEQAQTGQIEQIVSVMMQEYELVGPAVIRTLAIEHDIPQAGVMLKKGRSVHRKWCARVFAPYLNTGDKKELRLRIGLFYAATDVYAWKLLRQDLGYSKKETEQIFIRTLQGIILQIKSKP